MQEFIAPKLNPFVASFCKGIFPFWMKLRERLKINLSFRNDARERFLGSKRAVILANHPDRQDPFVVADLAVQTHEYFHCVAAREIFDWDFGLRGWLLKSLGCYSVMRGKVDFHSIGTTKKIMKEGKRKLVVFPEGEITADTKLHDVQKAVFHIALDVQKHVRETGIGEDALIFPVAINYVLEGDLADAVIPTLVKLETKFGLTEPSYQIRKRTDEVVTAYFSVLRDSYDLKEGLSDDLPAQAEETAIDILKKIASLVSFELNEEISPCDNLYAVRNFLAGKVEQFASVTHHQVFHCGGLPGADLRIDLERVERLLILQRTLLHHSSDIQVCRSLDFIESEVFGRISPKGNQVANVVVDTPIELAEYAAVYEESKDKAVEQLSSTFANRINSLLSQTPRVLRFYPQRQIAT